MNAKLRLKNAIILAYVTHSGTYIRGLRIALNMR